MKKIILIFGLLLILTNCSTYVEEAINKDFKPLTPSVAEMKATKANNGAIYSTSSPGLFSSDKRAHQVGDILTVQLNETFSSTKNQVPRKPPPNNTNIDTTKGIPDTTLSIVFCALISSTY